MTHDKFRSLTERIIYLDGATGSNLVKEGMPSGVCPEQWILEHRDVMLKLQKRYVEAGSDILYAPTFTANRVKLAGFRCSSRQYSASKHPCPTVASADPVRRLLLEKKKKSFM